MIILGMNVCPHADTHQFKRKSLISLHPSNFVAFAQSGERREVCHYLYVSWPDFGVPKSASAMLDFREHVLQRREAAVQSLGSSWTGPPGGPPVVVHCSAGIGRTGKHMKEARRPQTALLL